MREPFAKFFADRGTHLAAMIAYFALLSFVPLVFLALSFTGLAGPYSESSFLVTELKKAFPGTSISRIVDVVEGIRRHSAALGIFGAVFLLWTALSLFSVLESALNIVYERPNRSFVHGKALALVLLVGSLIVLFVGLLAGSLGYDILKRYAPGVISNGVVAYTASVAASLVTVFIFLFSVYYFLPNEPLPVREVLPGAVTATILLEASFQTLPLYLRASEHVFAVQAFGFAILLVWLYLMANFIVFGAEVNWWLAGRGRETEEQLVEELPGLA